MAREDRQEIVEVMGDPARELSERLHLLRLAKLVLEVVDLEELLDSSARAIQPPDGDGRASAVFSEDVRAIRTTTAATDADERTRAIGVTCSK